MARDCPQKKPGKASAFSWGSKPLVESPTEVAAPSPEPENETPIEESGHESVDKITDAESEPPAPIHVQVLDEGDSSALVTPVSGPVIVTAPSSDSAPAKHSSLVNGAAADLVALEFSRQRNTASSLKAKSKVKPKRSKHSVND